MISRFITEETEVRFQNELRRYPPFLRLTKGSLITAAVIAAVMIIAFNIIYRTVLDIGTPDMLSAVENFVLGMGYLMFLFIGLGIIALWFAICLVLEKRAYKKASKASAVLARAGDEHSRIQHEAFIRNYTPVIEKTPEPVFCPKCGLLADSRSTSCITCGAPLD